VRATARAPDGVIEAIEVSAPALCLGVQWELQEQPESPVFELVVEAPFEAAVGRGRSRPRRESRGARRWDAHVRLEKGRGRLTSAGRES
jgi:Peptidase C26